jgi:hypothetical protein
MHRLPVSQEIDSKFVFFTKILPDIRGIVFLTRPFFRFLSSHALIKFGGQERAFEMDLNQEYELGIFLKNKPELAVPYVVAQLSVAFKLDTFVDVGANVGWVSRIVASFSVLKSIYSFEPNNKAFNRLKDCAGDTIHLSIHPSI